MKKIKYYIIVSESISLKKISNVYYLFPLKDFSVGFTKTYELADIKNDNSYLYINRILHTKDIEKLKQILTKLPNNIIGIFFEDLGVYELIKHMPIEKNLYAMHANCSYMTINTYLKYMTTIVVSPDITLDETNEILKNATKPVILYGLGYLPTMYSRRMLNQNYASHYKIASKKILNIKETITKYPFISVENEWGTMLYDDHLYCLKPNIKSQNITGFLINSFYTNMDAKELIKTFKNQSLEHTGFLDNKTTNKIKEV